MSQPRLILHMGGAKTGSSYLQHCFAVARDALAETGVLYMDHESVARAALGEATLGNGRNLADILRVDTKEADTSGTLVALKQTLRAAEGRDVLISSEGLAAFHPRRFRRLAMLADSCDYRIKLVYYVRSIAGAALSTYRQRVKRHLLTADFSEWISSQYKYIPGSVVRKMGRVIDTDAIHVYNYDHVREDLYRHFARAVLNPDAEKIQVPRQQINRSLTAAEVALMRHLNALLTHPSHGIAVGDALTRAPVATSEQAFITPEQHDILCQQAADQLDSVNELLPPGEAIGVLGPDIEVRDCPPPTLSENEKMLVAVLAEVIAKDLPPEKNDASEDPPRS